MLRCEAPEPGSGARTPGSPLLSSHPALGVENEVEIQTFVLELKNMTKEKEGGRERTDQEPKSSASDIEGLVILSLWPAPNTLPSELQVTLMEGSVYAGKKENVLRCTSSFKDKFLRERSTRCDKIEVFHCRKPAGP